MSVKPLYITLLLSLAFFGAQAQKKSFRNQQGDRAFEMFDYKLAADNYLLAIKCHKPDSAYALRKVADCYRLMNDPAKAKQWYGRLVDMPAADPLVKFYYAEASRQLEDYTTARKYYEQYKAVAGDNRNVSDILTGLDNVAELAKKNPNYTIQLMPFNSGFSDFGPAFYNKDSIFFSSNRTNKYSGEADRWSYNSFYNIYKAPANVAGGGVSRIIKKRPNGKFHDGPLVYNASTYLMIFTRSNYIKSPKTAADKKTVNLKLYSMVYPSTKKPMLFSLPFNDNNYSNAHPTLTKDGKTLYFASDRPGGLGGTDIYRSERSGDAWTAPVNLGPEINSKYDEKFPFISDEGVLYFASNALGGLGGLDIYESKKENGKWVKATNMGAPLNSSYDDFGLIYKGETSAGYFTSNRKGGMGDDDIYSFTKKTTLERPITIKVLDAETKLPIEGASVSLPCATGKMNKFAANRSGEVKTALSPNAACAAEASYTGYANNSTNVDYKDKDGTYTILLTKRPATMKLLVAVKERGSERPVRDFNVAIQDKAGAIGQRMFVTNPNGEFETSILPVGYSVNSPDAASIADNILATETPDASGYIKRVYYIDQRRVSVPLTSDCFEANSKVILTNKNTRDITYARVEEDGKLHLALMPNTKYSVEYDGKNDEFETKDLKPGDVINLKCKFVVGQTWILQNIYYDLNKSFIRPDAAKELNHLVDVMKQNPTLEIELSSHTDCRQTVAYNMSLSVRRAKSAVEYIVSRGVSSRRMIAAGYGESKLVNGCACEPTNESPCSDEQHQLNRRTEVKVLKY